MCCRFTTTIVSLVNLREVLDHSKTTYDKNVVDYHSKTTYDKNVVDYPLPTQKGGIIRDAYHPL